MAEHHFKLYAGKGEGHVAGLQQRLTGTTVLTELQQDLTSTL